VDDEGWMALKSLVRSLLCLNPVERISFEEFFLHPSVNQCHEIQEVDLKFHQEAQMDQPETKVSETPPSDTSFDLARAMGSMLIGTPSSHPRICRSISHGKGEPMIIQNDPVDLPFALKPLPVPVGYRRGSLAPSSNSQRHPASSEDDVEIEGYILVQSQHSPRLI
jgi:hypothetical protein